MIKKFRIKKIDSVEKYLQIYKGIFSLTDKEIEVLSEMIRYYLRGRMAKEPSDPFASAAKAIITKNIGMKNPYSINTYIQRLREKGAIVNKPEQPYQIHPWLIPVGEKFIEIELEWMLNLKTDRT